MLFRTASLFVLIAIWHLASLVIANEVILPSPQVVAETVGSFLITWEFYIDLAVTLVRSFAGLALALICGILCGAAMGYKTMIRSFIRPVVVILQATPAISWLLLVLVWFSGSAVPLIIVFLASFPIIALNTETGVLTTDRKLLEMANLFKVKRSEKIRKIYLPSIRNYVASSLSITTGLTIRVAVMAEVLSHPGSGIGERLSWARLNVEMPALFGYTIIIVLASLLLTSGIHIQGKRSHGQY